MTNVYHHYRKSLLLIVFFCVQFVFNSFAGAAGNVTTNRDSTIVDSLPPFISSFTPIVGRNGTAVLIFGKHLTGTVKVSFGGTLASNFIVLSDTAIKAVVGTGSTGSVMVATLFGTASKPGFIFIQDSTLAPVITSFNPTSARRGSKVLIKGIHFIGTNAVRFGGVLADTVTLVNDTLVIAVVGAGASGSVSVTTPLGTGSKAGFIFIQDSTLAPVITSFNPTSGRQGEKVIIRGTHFTGTNAVRFGGVLANTITFVNDTVVIAVIGAGASGNVSVTTPLGTASKPGFTFIQDSTLAPVITSFNPTSARRGSKVLISGTHFTGTNAVRFGGVLADTVTLVNDTLVIAVVGAGASGSVSVTTPLGTASKPGFIFIQDSTLAPVITSFNPTSARRGSKVLIKGIHFIGTNAVRFGGVLADTVTLVNDTLVIAVVGAGASGSVSVTTPFGTGSKAGFIFIQDSTLAPVITSFNPTSARRGSKVLIKGIHFIGTNAVRFGGVLADTVTLVNDTLVIAVVGAGASGSVSVTTPLGTGSKAGFIFIQDSTLAPVITSFNPTSARRGSKVLIKGIHFIGTNAVRFGGVLADTVTLVNDTLVIAVVGAGASGSVSVTTPLGTGSKAGFTFIQDSTLTPVVTSFNPTSGRQGEKVIIRGTHFTGTNAVRFGGVLANTITFVNDTVVIAVIGAGASGNVSVTTPLGTGSKAGFTFIQDTILPPVISFFTPDTATTGTFVNIKGAHFTGANAVRFGGVLADTFSVLNDSLLWAVVGAGASGNVSVTTPFGTGVKPGFVFIGDSLFVTARSSVNSSSTVNTALSLYPNPASKYAIVINPITHHPSHLQVVDLMGRVVRTMNVGSEATKTTVDVSGLTAGIYKLVWNDGKKVIIHTLLVK